MNRLRPLRAAVRLVNWAVLVLLIAGSMTEFLAAQTAMQVANQRRAQLALNSVGPTSNVPNSSNLGAISASVGAGIDRRINADRQIDLFDPDWSPLRLVAPNRNGEDSPSGETEPATLTPSNGGRTKYSGVSAVPFSASTSNPGRRTSRQNASVLREKSPGNSLNQHHPSIHHSAPARRADHDSWAPTTLPSARENLGRTRVHGSNLTGLRKARYQQDICSKLYLSALECRAKLRQQQASAARPDSTQSYLKSLETIR